MSPTLRAARALVLLAGFYLLSLVLLAALGALDWAAFTWTTGSVAVKLFILSVVLAIPIVRGMFTLRTPKDDGLTGLPVTDTQEPRLWAAVRDIAQQVGTRAPDEIVLNGDVNAAVSEDAGPRLRAGLLQPAGGELVRQRRARRQLSWTDSATLKLPEGYEETLPAALDAAVADVPDTEPLRRLLAP